MSSYCPAISVRILITSNDCSLAETTFLLSTALTYTHPSVSSELLIPSHQSFCFLDNLTSLFVNAHSCGINTTDIGSYCNTSGDICHVQNPCLNSGNCTSLNNNQDYYCSCPLGFSGKRCQVDGRSCKPTTCLNNGEFSCSSE